MTRRSPAPAAKHRRLRRGALLRSTLIAAAAFAIANRAHADNDSAELARLEAQIAQIQAQNAAEIAGLKAELRQMRERLNNVDAERAARPGVISSVAVATAPPPPSSTIVYRQPAITATSSPASNPLAPRLIESPTHQFGFASANGANTISIIARMQFDGGDYLSVNPEGGYKGGAGPGSLAGGPLESGVNARRVRFGIGGTFETDWAYRLIYDFGSSSDSLNPSVSGAQTSGIENAYLTFNGLNGPGRTVPVAFDAGYLDIPWTLDEATSSNDIMFLERASPQVVATEFGGGDFRSGLGARSSGKRYWAGAYLTGPNSGAPHTGATNPAGAVLLRASYQLIAAPTATLHVGFDYGRLLQARAPYNSSTTGGVATNSDYLILGDRPELRVDPTTIINTGGIPAKNASIYDAELAGSLGPFYAQGEFFHYQIDQYAGGKNPADGVTDGSAPSLGMNGGYAEASYSIGGTRHYIPATGAYSAVIPRAPFDVRGGGYGAFEFSARYSMIDLDSNITAGAKPNLTGGVEGGVQSVYAVGLNWYPNINLKFMFDFLHADIDKVKPTTTGADPTEPDGARINAIAARAQFAY